jgi:hypothetical protein
MQKWNTKKVARHEAEGDEKVRRERRLEMEI